MECNDRAVKLHLRVCDLGGLQLGRDRLLAALKNENDGRSLQQEWSSASSEYRRKFYMPKLVARYWEDKERDEFLLALNSLNAVAGSLPEVERLKTLFASVRQRNLDGSRIAVSISSFCCLAS